MADDNARRSQKYVHLMAINIRTHFLTKIELIKCLLNVHKLTAADRYDFETFPSPLDLRPSSMSLYIIETLGAGLTLAAALAIFFS